MSDSQAYAPWAPRGFTASGRPLTRLIHDPHIKIAFGGVEQA